MTPRAIADAIVDKYYKGGDAISFGEKLIQQAINEKLEEAAIIFLEGNEMFMHKCKVCKTDREALFYSAKADVCAQHAKQVRSLKEPQE